ncbi:PAAR-like domain-containing protein [Rubellimicrobium arenae]|uniref:PAAR-like domain-containing protein n=1 Tax=Rubellimicrobium arenae TaxID=2817372 RepID=UPI001B30B5D8|nr:PAAR-like domain-containing protein [Rubellimicrobium arenae]
MRTVSIHPPKSPVTKGCIARSQATTPNVCKMPGPPAPFVPTPLPNTGMSNLSPSGYSQTVKIEKTTVAIGQATFKSIGDIASKGTGGGLISANAHGVTKFIPPGSLTVKIEGKPPHLHGEQMLNNCADGGTPPNTGATMMGTDAGTAQGKPVEVPIAPDCKQKTSKKSRPWNSCQAAQVCSMAKAYNESTAPKKAIDSPGHAAAGTRQRLAYDASLRNFTREFQQAVATHGPDSPQVKAFFYSPPAPPAEEADCVHKAWRESAEGKKGEPPARSGTPSFNPDHMHPASLSGPLTSANMRWADSRVNQTVGPSMDKKDLKPKPGQPAPLAKPHENCKCP